MNKHGIHFFLCLLTLDRLLKAKRCPTHNSDCSFWCSVLMFRTAVLQFSRPNLQRTLIDDRWRNGLTYWPSAPLREAGKKEGAALPQSPALLIAKLPQRWEDPVAISPGLPQYPGCPFKMLSTPCQVPWCGRRELSVTHIIFLIHWKIGPFHSQNYFISHCHCGTKE